MTEECGDVYQNTVFTIRADELLTGGTSLRFLRKGDDRGDVELAQMKPGQTVRIALPKRVCTGVNRSTLEIQVLRRPQGSAAPQVVDGGVGRAGVWHGLDRAFALGAHRWDGAHRGRAAGDGFHAAGHVAGQFARGAVPRVIDNEYVGHALAMSEP